MRMGCSIGQSHCPWSPVKGAVIARKTSVFVARLVTQHRSHATVVHCCSAMSAPVLSPRLGEHTFQQQNQKLNMCVGRVMSAYWPWNFNGFWSLEVMIGSRPCLLFYSMICCLFHDCTCLSLQTVVLFCFLKQLLCVPSPSSNTCIDYNSTPSTVKIYEHLFALVCCSIWKVPVLLKKRFLGYGYGSDAFSLAIPMLTKLSSC